jgi:hypothetical protein
MPITVLAAFHVRTPASVEKKILKDGNQRR